MEIGDLYVRVGPRARGDGFPLTFRWLTLDGRRESAMSPVGIRVDYAQEFLQALESHVREHQAVATRTLLLDIRAKELYRVDWEGAIQSISLAHTWNVVRFADRSDQWVAVPFELPARILRAGDASADLPTEPEVRYFRLTRLYGPSTDELTSALRRGRFDIAHVTGSRFFPHFFNQSEKSGFASETRPSAQKAMSARTLLRALKAGRVRFLILESVSGPSSTVDYTALLEIAHFLQAGGGPTTAVFEQIDRAGIEDLYMHIVHDSSLDAAVWKAAKSARRAAIFEAIGGANVLSIRPVAGRMEFLARRTEEGLRRIAADKGPGGLVGYAFPASPLPPSKLEARASSVLTRIYDTSHESGAWMPLPGDSQELGEIGKEVRAKRMAMARVLNVGLWQEGSPLSRRSPIEPAHTYEVVVSVAQAQSWSLVKEKDARPIPESELQDHYGEEGVPLRVVVSAKGFGPEVIEHELLLPRPPTGSKLLRIPVRAPKARGRYRIRVALYHDNNLLQSVLLHVQVGPASQRQRGPTVTAEVEFALMDSVVDPHQLPGRTVNILCNATDDGTHTFQVVGQALKKTFDFGEGEMRTAVDAARETLNELAADRSSGEQKYRFDEKNVGRPNQFEAGLLKLAESGYALFSSIVTDQDRAFEGELLAALGNRATIQVASTKSARYVFPWSMVYDHPFIVGVSKVVCPQFLTDLRTGIELSTAVCFKQGCPHRLDKTVVCPSGFWGFKHVLEQPWSVKAAPDPLGPSTIVTELTGGPPSVLLGGLVALSRDLSQAGDHEKEVGDPKLPVGKAWHLLIKDTKAEILLHLQAAGQLHLPLIYFYCHGRRAGKRTWLGIGTGEELVPGDLKASEIDWRGASPLVVINGCHTVDLTPDDLLNFNQVLAWCGAAGVVGTEISIPEVLARDFAMDFLVRLANHEEVGEALRSYRFSLLQRLNPLGLAYTPYCSASLHLVRH